MKGTTMQERKRLTRSVALFGLLLLLLTLLVVGNGCAAMQELDKAIWKPLLPPDAAVGQVEPVPPVVQIAAAIAASLGFGGLSTWVARSNKKTTNGQKALADRLADIERRITELSRDG